MIRTRAHLKIEVLKKRFRIIKGGMSSSKTYSIMQILLNISVTKPGTVATVLTSTYPLLRDGVLQDTKNIFNEIKWPFDNWYHRSDKELKFPNGSVIQYRNLDAIDTFKGKGSRRDYLFANEVNRLSWMTLEPYIVRTDKAVYLDFNHDKHFWLDDMFIDANRNDTELLILTYKDNSQIPRGELLTINERIKASKMPGASANMKQWVNVFCYGMKGQLTDRQIYTYILIDKIPDTAKRINSGMDFGVSPDPTVLVDLYIDGVNLYADELFSLNNLMPEKITGAERMAIVDQMELINFPKGWKIIADSAGRTEIIDLRKHGYTVIAIKKPPGSVIDGINKLRGYNLHVTNRSKTVRKGVESWFWKIDPNGKIIPEPDGHEPDGLAAIRYAVMANRK